MSNSTAIGHRVDTIRSIAEQLLAMKHCKANGETDLWESSPNTMHCFFGFAAIDSFLDYRTKQQLKIPKRFRSVDNIRLSETLHALFKHSLTDN